MYWVPAVADRYGGAVMQIKHLTASKRLCEKQGQLLAKRFLTLEKQMRWTDSQGVVGKAKKA
jgi:hypothetical protein